MTMSARLSLTLRERGMSAGKCSELLGYGPNYVRRIVTGETPHPSIHRVIRIAEVLDVDFAWLALGDDDE